MRQLEGINSVLEAIHAGVHIHSIHIAASRKDNPKLQTIIKQAKKNKIPLNHDMPVSKTRQDQGVIALADDLFVPQLKTFLNKNSTILVAPEIDYEFNLGSMLRSAACFGINCILTGKKSVKVTSLVMRHSEGGCEHVPVLHVNVFNALKQIQKAGIPIFGLALQQSTSIAKMPLTKPVAFVVGSEQSGIDDTLAKYIDQYIHIPMTGVIDSLNMAVAAAIAMYEIKNAN